MTDSTTSKGWLPKTNFSATVCLDAAQMHAMNYMTLGICDYSQSFPGVDKVVANALSHDDDRSDKELTLIFCTHCPSQIPDHFKILPLPNEITLWLTALLLKLPERLQLFKRHTRTTLGHGTDGTPTASGSDSMTHSSMTSPGMLGSNSLECLPWLCEKQDF